MKQKVVCVTDISHEEWLNYRRSGIGGSDAAAVVGLNPYKSAFALYHDKLRQVEEQRDNEAMRLGRDLEDYVARRWMEETGKRVRRNNYMWRSAEHPFMLADIDREIIGENAALECKTASPYLKWDVAGGEIPPQYYCQCQHYMAVMGYDRMYLAFLIFGKGFYHTVIERDEKEISALISAEKAFWDCIEKGEPPAIDGSESTGDTISLLWPESTGTSVEFGSDVEQALAKLDGIADLIEDMKREEESIKNSIKNLMQECESATAGSYRLSWKSQSSMRPNAAKLRAARNKNPDFDRIYESCLAPCSSRPFKYSKIKES